MNNLTSIVHEYAIDPENIEKNYALGRAYEDMGQTAAAITYLLRTAERTSDDNLAYECLLRVGQCFDRQGNRHNTVRGMYKHAISVFPDRPEAYYFLAKFDNYYNNPQDAYCFASLGLDASKHDVAALRGDIGYPGTHGLMIEKATAGWSWGKIEQCKELLDYVVNNHWDSLSDWNKQVVNNCYTNYKFDRPKQPMKIVDCFTYYDVTCQEMLELRYNVLKDYVDKFVVTEANRTQTGEPIERKLRETIKRLGLPMDKFVIVDVDIPDDSALQILEIDKMNSYQNQNENSYRARARDRLMKNGLHQVLNQFNDNTYFIVSDCDEIINPVNLSHVINMVEHHRSYLVKIPLAHMEGRANLRVVYKNTGLPKDWSGAMFVCKKEHLQKAEVIHIRSNIYNPYQIAYIFENGKKLEDLGWHFSWMGDAQLRKKKLDAFCHRDDNFDFMSTGGYNNVATLGRIEVEPVEGAISVGCEVNSVLVHYPESNLPSVMLENDKLRAFFLGENFTLKGQ